MHHYVVYMIHSYTTTKPSESGDELHTGTKKMNIRSTHQV